MANYPVQVQSFQLIGAGAVSGATTLTLASFKSIIGTNLTMADFGDIGYGVLEPNTINEDSISFTGITQNSNGTATLTGVNSVGFVTPFTTGTGLRVSHAGSVTFIITNSAAFYANFGNKNNDEILTGHWEAPTPLASTGIANKSYVDNLVNGGAVSYAAVIVSATAATTISAGQVVYLNSSGRWDLADATNSAKVFGVQLGIAQGSGTSGNAITGGVLITGVDGNQTSLSAGTTYYIRNGGGLPSSSAGNYSRVIGVATSATTLSFNANETSIDAGQVSTTSTVSIIPKTGTGGYMSETFIDDNVAINTDQSQSTSNSTVAVGEVNLTTKHYYIAEKFVPAYPTMRGVTLWKIADTGSFTGTVKVSIQADSSGSPSLVDLASYTISNAVWLKLNAAAAFSVAFTSEYNSLVVGQPYWIVVEPSTNDNSNHPNLGANSAGGYASGSLKYYNTIDGWTQIVTSILYFTTLVGIVSKLAKTNSEGLLLSAIRPYSLIAADTNSSSVTSTTTETTVFSKQIAGGTFSNNAGIKARITGHVTGANGSGADIAVTVKLKYNGSTLVSIASPTALNTGNGIGGWTFFADFLVLNNNSTTSQLTIRSIPSFPTSSQGTPGATSAYFNPSGTVGTASVDLGAPGLLEVTYTNGSATGSSDYTAAIIEKIAGSAN